jgi:hypothetical protein
LGSLILKTAYWYNREEFLIHLYGIIEQNGEQNGEIIKMIDNIIINNNTIKEKSAVIRILNGENFEEIEIK